NTAIFGAGNATSYPGWTIPSGAPLQAAATAASGTGAAFTFTPDDNGLYVVTLQATGTNGATGRAAVTLPVTNVAPTASLANNGPVNEASPATVSFANPFDPSAADTAAGFHYAFAADGGSLAGATYANSGMSASASFTFDDGPSDHTVT